MITEEFEVDSMSNVDDLTERLYDTYSRVEVIKCVKTMINVIVLVAVGY